jgi:hypothetical protein
MNALLIFCAYMTFVYVPWDFFVKEMARDEEVWLGLLLHGFWAKLTEPLHWVIFAAGTYGFWRMRPWMWPWAGVYAGQIAVGMLVWALVYLESEWRWPLGLASMGLLAVPTVALLRARPRFQAGLRPGSLRERYGDWALVTGASAGIGAEFARALARGGLNVVLTARREDRLRGLAAELEKEHSVSTRVVAADLAAADGADRVADAVADLEIAVLVNNAGFGYSGRFDKLEPARLREMVRVNCEAPTVLTGRLLPAMVRRGRGAVIFTGSVAAFQPLPLHGLYSATKVFDQFLAESLWGELRGSGVDVLVLQPGSTDTEFQAVAGEIAHPGEPAADVVRVALEALGKQPSVTSGWFNWLRGNAAARLLPRSLLALLAKDVMAKQTPEAMR